MFDQVMNWLENDDDDLTPGFDDDETRLAVAALFYHLAAVDGDVSAPEKERLRELLIGRYHLCDAQYEKLDEAAQAMEESTAGIYPYTIILNRQLSDLERHSVFSQLQALAMADGQVEEVERDLLAHVRNLLKLS